MQWLRGLARALIGVVPLIAPAFADSQACLEVQPQTESALFQFVPSADHDALATQIPPGAIIRNIRVTRFAVFDREDPEEDNRIYRWANDFHSTTREWVIRDQLLFTEGDRYQLVQMQESERILRDLRFIFDATVRAYRRCGDEVDVEVYTRDIWTLTPLLSFTRSGGENEYTIGIRDSNFLGTGKAVTVRYEQDEERSGVNLLYSDPAIMGSRWRGRITLTDNDDGHERGLNIVRPFYSVYETWSAGLAVEDVKLEENLFFRGDEVAEFNRETQMFRLFGGLADDPQPDKQIGRWLFGYRYEDNEFSFSDSDIPPPELPADRTYSYPFAGFQSLEDEFVKLYNFDYLGRTEDVYVGERYRWTLGYSPEALGGTRDQIALQGNYGNTLKAIQKTVWTVEGELDGFYNIDDESFENLWLTAETRYHHRQAERWAVFARLRLDYTDGLTIDRQLTLGGDNGLRGYDRNYQVGDRSYVFNLEQRYYSDWHPFRLVRVGLAAFFDVGRAWFDGEDNGSNGDVLANAGFGLRFNSSRAEKGSVIHVDLAFPFMTDDDVDSVQFLISVRDRF
ncbi:MAG: BamA/TamA family outer membrane protein [Pseudomonadota bacterium]